MQNILKDLERRSGADASAPSKLIHDPRRAELAERLRALPFIPREWRRLVHPRIATAVTDWSWADGNLLLLGTTGCGKTVGVVALAKRLLACASEQRDWERARRIVFVDAARLALAREQHGLGGGEAPLVERCMNAPLLIVDEVGYLDKDTGVLEQVVDARNKSRLPIVLTSGMEPQELHERYGAATARKMMGAVGRDAVIQVFMR
jgi:DNA replication protein DnaC